MRKREALDACDFVRRRLGRKQRLNRQARRTERQRDELQVLVRLARTRGRRAVVKPQSVVLIHASPKREEVALGQRRLLWFKGTRHDEQMVVDDVVFVEQTNVAFGNVRDKEVLFVRK